MKKDDNFRLQSLSPADAQQLAAIVSLGMCVAVQERCVTPRYACDALFRPSLVESLREMGADSALCDALHEALFIEDVTGRAMETLVEKVKNAMILYLRTYNWPDQQDGTNWTAPYP